MRHFAVPILKAFPLTLTLHTRSFAPPNACFGLSRRPHAPKSSQLVLIIAHFSSFLQTQRSWTSWTACRSRTIRSTSSINAICRSGCRTSRVSSLKSIGVCACSLPALSLASLGDLLTGCLLPCRKPGGFYLITEPTKGVFTRSPENPAHRLASKRDDYYQHIAEQSGLRFERSLCAFLGTLFGFIGKSYKLMAARLCSFLAIPYLMSITNHLWSKVLTDDRDMVRRPATDARGWQLISSRPSYLLLRSAGDWRSTDRLPVPPFIYGTILD